MKIISLLFLLAIGAAVLNTSFAAELPTPLVETSWLAAHLNEVSVVDVRTNKKNFISNPVFQKDKKTGKQYLVRVGGHIPGASLVLYKNVRGKQVINGLTVKHMLPAKADFESLMQQAGVNRDSKIVITTNADSDFDLTMASRMYWQLKYYGHESVSILNGGTAQWLEDGREYSIAEAKLPTGDWTVTKERTGLLAGSEEVHAVIENDTAQLVDVRPLGQYLGTYKSSKVKAKGHIPTAKSFPVDLAAIRYSPVKFVPPSELKKIITALGIHNEGLTIAYCNTGHMAAGGWFVLHELLGNKNAKLYDGSMHQWTMEKRPVVSMKME